jgi:uncharacterized protein YhbP (UPF0306 family)
MKITYKEPYDFLNGHKLAILSTVGDKSRAWGSAIYYVADETLTFYFLTHADSKKYHNILKHPHVALTVADNDTQTTVQAAGLVERVPIGDEHDLALRKLARIRPSGEFSWAPPVSKLYDGQTILLKVQPNTLQFADFKADSSLSGDRVTRII